MKLYVLVEGWNLPPRVPQRRVCMFSIALAQENYQSVLWQAYLRISLLCGFMSNHNVI